MEPRSLSDALALVPIFSTLPPQQLEEIARVTTRSVLERGAVLFSEGDSADFLPVLLAGRIKLCRADADGREHVLHLVRAPASFAEAAVFGSGVFPANAEAMEPCTVARTSRHELLALLRRRPEVALALLAAMSMWLRRLVDLIDGLALRTVEERVAAYLWSVFARSGRPLVSGLKVDLEDPKHVVAAVCGTAPEVLSRTFRRLEHDGAVKVEGPTVTLLGPDVLAALARIDQRT